MIEIKRTKDCCGCSGCVQVCPRKCISINKTINGFLYPVVDKDSCVECGLCEQVCPVINQFDERTPLKVYALKYDNDVIRQSSSSGGAFTLLAEQVINQGGVVFGARFDAVYDVVHDYVESRDDLRLFRGSKYVQSYIGQSFIQVKEFLQSGRKVMYTGTPCQISALKRYLRKDYANLITVDFICHGVPNQKLWEYYLNSEKKDSFSKLYSTNFRSKLYGWHNFSLQMEYVRKDGSTSSFYESHNSNPYFQLYMSNLMLRPSCYECPSRSGKSRSDITLGDFWGIDKVMPEFDDDKGTSLFIINNYIDLDIWNRSDVIICEVNYERSIENNQSYLHSPVQPILPITLKWFEAMDFKMVMKYIFPIYLFIYKAQNKLRSLLGYK